MPSAAGGWDLGTNYLDAVEQAQEVYDDAVAALESTKTTYGRAVSSANLPASTSNSAQIGQITYDQMKMELEKLEALQEAEGKILSPTDGIVTKCSVQTGEKTTDTTAILLAERMDEYILTPEISSPQETAVDQLRFLLDDAAAEQLIPHVNLFAYGNEVIRHDNAALTPYGLLHRADYQPMLSPSQEKQMDMGGPA